MGVKRCPGETGSQRLRYLGRCYKLKNYNSSSSYPQHPSAPPGLLIRVVREGEFPQDSGRFRVADFHCQHPTQIFTNPKLLIRKEKIPLHSQLCTFARRTGAVPAGCAHSLAAQERNRGIRDTSRLCGHGVPSRPVQKGWGRDGASAADSEFITVGAAAGSC